MKDSDEWALYETMVFADQDILLKLMDLSEQDTRGIIGLALGMPEIQKRYKAKEKALAGHKTMCEFVTFALKKM